MSGLLAPPDRPVRDRPDSAAHSRNPPHHAIPLAWRADFGYSQNGYGRARRPAIPLAHPAHRWPMAKIPPAPPLPGPNNKVTAKTGNAFLNTSDTQGAHNRSQHVGMSHQGLKNRITSGEVKGGTATSFLNKHDQNKAAASVMNTKGAVTTRNQVASGNNNNKLPANAPFNAKAIGARTAPIVKVAQKLPNGKIDTFNAKVTDTRMILKKGPGGVRSQSTFATGLQRLPAPAPGPSLKPTTKANVTSIANGAAGLRSVAKPAARPLDLAGQKQFRNLTKNAKPGMVTKPNKGK